MDRNGDIINVINRAAFQRGTGKCQSRSQRSSEFVQSYSFHPLSKSIFQERCQFGYSLE